MPEFVTLEEVPMLETGIEYPASTGPFTVSSAMLAECVEAQDDPHLLAPRLKIGHAANPIDDDLQKLWEEVNDGRDESQPSLGTILNMKVVNAGQTLVGDLYGLPKWLADILETAYPARSIEGGYWKNPANGKEYSFMLEALALLGVVGPGCTSLDDLQELFSDEGPKVTVIEMGSRPEVKANRDEGGTMPVVAQVNVEDIRRAFYEDFAQGDRYWWWDRELLIDPNEMIIEDPDAGQLYRLPIDLGDGEDAEVSFGDPEPVKVRYVPDPKGESSDDEEDGEVAASRRLIAPQLKSAGMVLAVNTTPPRESERKKEAHMDKVRERLGLPADATEDDILRAMDEQEGNPPSVQEPGESEGNPADQGGETGTPSPDAEEQPEGEATPESVGEPVAASGTVPVDSDTFAQLRRDAEAGRQAREAQIEAERTRLLDDAVKAGKFPPARRKHYASLLEKDPVGTKHLLTAAPEQGGLAPGMVPVGEVGAAGGDSDLQTDAYDPAMLSRAERKRIEAAREGEPPRIARDQQEVRVNA